MREVFVVKDVNGEECFRFSGDFAQPASQLCIVAHPSRRGCSLSDEEIGTEGSTPYQVADAHHLFGAAACLVNDVFETPCLEDGEDFSVSDEAGEVLALGKIDHPNVLRNALEEDEDEEKAEA